MKVEDNSLEEIGKAIIVISLCQVFGLLIAALFELNLYFGPVIAIILTIIVLKILAKPSLSLKEIDNNG